MFYSEIDKYAIKGYCAIHNQVEDDCLGSIIDIKGIDLPYCDMWFGGFPCQDISLAGKGKGFSLESESRSSLGWEMIRLLREVKEKPLYVVFENVAAIFNNTHRPILNTFKQDLEELGYTLYNDLLNAKDYGIPQNRNRYFLIAILGKYNYKFPKPIKLELRLKDMLEDEVDEKYYLSDKAINYAFKRSAEFGREPRINNEISHCLMSSELSKGASQHIELITDDFIKIPEDTKKGYSEARDGDGIYIDRPHQKRGVVQKGMTPTIKCSGDDLGVVVKSGDGIYLDQLSRNKANTERGISTTLKAQNCHNGVVEDLRIRKLTPKECYRLMGFKDEAFERAAKVISNSQLYKTAGNSIVVKPLKKMFINLFMLASERKLLE
jgi:DNA (cytosine-5)-methyltransferase 1